MYCAPEVLNGNRYNTAVDVYSFAITVFECLCGSHFVKAQYAHMVQARQEGSSGRWRPKPPSALVHNHPLVWALIQDAWRPLKARVQAQEVQKSRPTFLEIVARLESMRPAGIEAPNSSASTPQSFYAQSVPLQPNEIATARPGRQHGSPTRGLACFLVHHKQDGATEARIVKKELESVLDASVFLGK